MRNISPLQGDTFELIAWREFGRVFGVVEDIIRLNRSLITVEPFPPGLSILLPDQVPLEIGKIRRLGD